MSGDVVTAARWLGGSILLASVILVGGWGWLRPAGPVPIARDRPPASSRLEVSGPRPTAERVPILDPVPGDSTACLDPPGEREIWDKLATAGPGRPASSGARRENARFQIEKIGEKVDPCKVYPLAGPCRLVHCHYKCTVSYDERSSVDHPVPFHHLKHREEVVYLDKDQLVRCAGPVAAAQP